MRPDLPIVFAGSCFADNISARMRQCLWDAENPFGVLYNPMSIARALECAVLSDRGDEIFRESLFESGGAVRSWLYDSKAAAFSIDECLEKFQAMSVNVKSKLELADALVITFGTAWVYTLNECPGEYIVANCHKMPSREFSRRRLGIDEICDVWIEMAKKLRSRYPKLQIIFTVSPVRHLKDGFEGNARSKAVLLLAAERICESLDYCHYFPAYEILNDDLRDYRFYADDLVHPSAAAVEYIWEAFKDCYLDAEGKQFLKETENIYRLYHHRPILETPEQTEQRHEKALNRLRSLLHRHPRLLSIKPL